MRRALRSLFFLTIGAVGTGAGQFTPAGTGGVAALANALEQLGSNKRVLVIGAHPDDENSQLLAWLGRGAGAQAAYLSLTRGEGGQNLIGPELGAGLGIIRSGELLAARRIDGTRQYFTRAYDFGFSKSADEAFRFWPRDSLLKDVLDVIRRFRPQIIVTIFQGTPQDGHGQHQVAGLLARQAFDLLRDSTWGPVKLYRSSSFDSIATTLRLPSGVLDPVIGQSYLQIAAASRSQHRSQDFGGLQPMGPGTIRLGFLKGRPGVTEGASIFAGVDTVMQGRERFTALIDSARAALNPWSPQTIVPLLARALHELGSAPADDEQRRILAAALAAAAGVAVDGLGDDGIVIPGQRIQVEVSAWNAGAFPVTFDSADVRTAAGWTVERFDPIATPIESGRVVTKRFVVNVAGDAARSQPYFLRRPLVGGAMYDWTGVPADTRGEPFEPPPLEARLKLTVAGEPITLTREIVYRYRDQAVGEIRRPVFVTRPFDVAVTPDMAVWPIDGGSAAGAPRHFTVTVTNRNNGAASARVVMTPPAGWTPIPAESLAFTRQDETKSFAFTVSAPPGVAEGAFQLRVAAVGADGRRSEGALGIIDYPHLRPRPLEQSSTVQIRTVKMALPYLTRVAYVRGASDRVPEELQAIGVPLELLDADSLARGDLSHYDAIVIGSRAYEVDPALVANNGRILDYARNGGLVLVQYQQYPFIQGKFAPESLTIAQPHDRVTDETAAVTLLDSANAVFHRPNTIGPEDWKGWVQERGLYFAHTWDSTYTPLLEMHDPGEAPLRGSLLVAPLGRGTYVYTGLSFFRELPAGVPGAYRLFLNLLGLRRTNVP